MKNLIYPTLLLSFMATAAMAQSTTSDKWLYDHAHYSMLTNDAVSDEADYYYKYDDEGTLRQTHKVVKKTDGNYSHTYDWWIHVFDKLTASRHIEAVNSSEDNFFAGVSYETRLVSNRTDELFTTQKTFYNGGSQTPYMREVCNYHYNLSGQPTSYDCTRYDLNDKGDITQERLMEQRTFEWDDNGRITAYTIEVCTYTKDTETNAYKKVLTRTEKNTDLTYAGAALTDMPADVASTDWDNWIINGSNLASATVATTYVNENDASENRAYGSAINIVARNEDGSSYWKYTNDSRDEGRYFIDEKTITDSWGSFNDKQIYYFINKNTEPTETNFSESLSTTRTYTSPYEYEEKEYTTIPGYQDNEHTKTVTMTVDTDADKGYITRTVKKQENIETGRTYTTIYAYDGFHRAGETVGITTTNADTQAPTQIYNMQGMAVGQHNSTLPSGLYIVKQGGKAVKMLRK